MRLFDASSVIHAWDNYPIFLFPPLWDWLQQEIQVKNLAISRIALEEVEKVAPDCATWLKDQGISVLSMSDGVLAKALWIKKSLGIYGDQYSTKGVGENDILIVATASVHSLPLISDEGRQFDKPKNPKKFKIPAVCELPGVDVVCISFLQLIRESGTVFKK